MRGRGWSEWGGPVMAEWGDANITLLLRRMGEGDPAAGEHVFDIVYEELHGLATRLMRNQAPRHTLQASALVNEAYLRLAGGDGPNWEGLRHFLCVAARAMRCVLVDHARRQGRRKRRPDGKRQDLDAIVLEFQTRATDLLDLDEALGEFAALDEEASRVVELRFFGGQTVKETALALDRSVRSVERDWEFARAWLRDRLS